MCDNPTNEYDVKIESIKLEQLKVELEIKKIDQLIIEELSNQFTKYTPEKFFSIPKDGYFKISIGNTIVKLERCCNSKEYL